MSRGKNTNKTSTQSKKGSQKSSVNLSAYNFDPFSGIYYNKYSGKPYLLVDGKMVPVNK